MHFYRERLYAPPTWWVVGMITFLIFGAVVWTGFDLAITIAVFAILVGTVAAFLINWGRVTIEVSDGELRAGRDVLALNVTGEVRALDEDQAGALRGPRADPLAYTLIRPYLRYAVYVEIVAPDVPYPYWLVATRHPEELAAAIESARPVVRPGGLAIG